IGHVGHVISGMFKVGDEVELKIDTDRRNLICGNHSATHLLQRALRMVLGGHVEQAGSDVDEARLRFDFTHFSAMTPSEIKQVEEIVNEQIAQGLEVHTDIMDVEEAKKTGAMALFGEKYAEKVRVVSMGDFSKELCGGTHVSNTNTISCFKIISENGISAGVRRIEALTSKGLLAYYADIEEKYNKLSQTAKVAPDMLETKIAQLIAENKQLASENEKLKAKMASDSLGNVMNQVVEVKGVKVLAASIDGAGMNELRTLSDDLRDKLGDGVIVLASAADGKVNLIAAATDSVQNKGVHAGNLIKEIAPIVGGGGGGRPSMAQAGGKNPEGIEEALKKAVEVITNQIK
ncbi:MAG: alanine--tRNA ligase, partial [Lachnospiraceae bacterium]|nr:alanine--tRNA ligase [Candidatus Minthocola equi]